MLYLTKMTGQALWLQPPGTCMVSGDLDWGRVSGLPGRVSVTGGRVSVTWVGCLLRGSGVCDVGRVSVTWVGCL